MGAFLALAGAEVARRYSLYAVGAAAVALMAITAVATVIHTAVFSPGISQSFVRDGVANTTGLGAGVLALVIVVFAARAERSPSPAGPPDSHLTSGKEERVVK